MRVHDSTTQRLNPQRAIIIDVHKEWRVHINRKKRMNPLPALDELKETNEQVSILRNQGFPLALARALALQSTRAFPLRLFVVDNSGSMREADGRRLVASSTKENVKWVQTTRWEELKVSVSRFDGVGVVAFSMRHRRQ